MADDSPVPAGPTRAASLPPRWVIRGAWAIHRAIYRPTRGRGGRRGPAPGPRPRRDNGGATAPVGEVGLVRRRGQPRLLVRQKAKGDRGRHPGATGDPPPRSAWG